MEGKIAIKTRSRPPIDEITPWDTHSSRRVPSSTMQRIAQHVVIGGSPRRFRPPPLCPPTPPPGVVGSADNWTIAGAGTALTRLMNNATSAMKLYYLEIYLSSKHVPLDLTRFERIFTGLHLVTLGCNGYPSSFTGFHYELLSFIVLFWVLLGYTWIYLVIPVF